MIDKDTEFLILRHYLIDKWRPGTIGRQLGVHHGVVRRVLQRGGIAMEGLPRRRSMVDPFGGFITETLARYPDLCASNLFQMVRERGYTGGPDHFRAMVRRFRPAKAAEAYLRLRTLAGEQAQVDWGCFGHVEVPGGKRPLSAFVMVLSWSRMVFLRFSLNQQLGGFLQGHQDAFDFFGGVPRVLLYDNLKSAVLERIGDAIRFNPTLLAFANHSGFEPRPCAAARGNEKGRVERAIRYIRTSFFAARTWRDLDDLNDQARAWCLGLAADRRCPGDRNLKVREAFEQEQATLRPAPVDAFPSEDCVEVAIGKTPYARFDGNDYSVPPTWVRRSLTIRADATKVRLLNGCEVLASHLRSWGKGQTVEDPQHVAELVQWKRAATEARGMDRLYHAAPQSRVLLTRLGERGENLGAATVNLLRLLDGYGAAALDGGIEEALRSDRATPHAVRQILEQRRRQAGQTPPIPVTLPNDPRVRDVHVRPHSLASYNQLTGVRTDDR
ncbi:MAG: IS21 family transposase [Candidatus Sericytochromatia bacterium]|nr:IS21 family transposase [Candidatus Tanganyikabacteria bacterium]